MATPDEENSKVTAESAEVAVAREMLEMLTRHAVSSLPQPLRNSANEAIRPRFTPHEIHELADGAARLIAATSGVPLTRPVQLKREAQ